MMFWQYSVSKISTTVPEPSTRLVLEKDYLHMGGI